METWSTKWYFHFDQIWWQFWWFFGQTLWQTTKWFNDSRLHGEEGYSYNQETVHFKFKMDNICKRRYFFFIFEHFRPELLPASLHQSVTKNKILLLMSVRLAWKSAAKSNEKFANEKYVTLFLSWMPFRLSLLFS